jgi:uncharacterized protein
MGKESKIIGKVSATEKMPSTIDDFYFWTEQNEILSPFDIVKVSHEDNSFTFGMIEEINHVTDAPSHFTSYISSDFGDTSENIGNMMRLGINYVKARVVGNTKNIYTPVLNGKQVSLCSEDEVQKALGLDKVKNPITCGYMEMYTGENKIEIRVDLNDHFLIGPEGAHLNVSGISGLAAKTSYSMFLLNAIQQKFKKDTEQSVAFVLFNVKGRDLMAIDEVNESLEDSDKKIYKDLGLNCEPFTDVKYYYPYSKEDRQENVQTYSRYEDVKGQISKGKAFKYKFTYENSKEDLDLLLANEEDTTGTMESCVNLISNQSNQFKQVDSWSTLKEEVEKCSQVGQKDNKEITVSSWRKFNRCIKKAINNNIFAQTITGRNNEVYLPEEIKEKLTNNQVMVIDIARLDENTQGFVFGSVARAIYDLKLSEDRINGKPIPDKIIFFIDELNKYASNDIPKNSPILKQLLDIAERGRSLGIIMFSVEQFRSAIHDRVKGNCSTSCYGRTNAIEVSKQDYRYIPKVYQNMMTRLTQGEYIIQNPALRSIINIKFPKPLYKQFNG